jgi:hypothetical protein
VSLIIQTLVRSITNSHSSDDAATILFREHRMGTGSGWLPDYLDGLPGLDVDLKRCRAISDSNALESDGVGRRLFFLAGGALKRRP